jgi:hypothetical protein
MFLSTILLVSVSSLGAGAKGELASGAEGYKRHKYGDQLCALEEFQPEVTHGM